MIFEEARKLMREGERITHPLLGEDMYLTAAKTDTGIAAALISININAIDNFTPFSLHLIMSDEWEIYDPL